jgi:hypothetical protein
MRLTAVVALLIASLGDRAAAQLLPKGAVPDALSCVACSLTVSPLYAIGLKEGDPFFTALPVALQFDGRGNTWVIPSNGDVPVVYDNTGRRIKAIGARGSGPGEFVSPSRFMPVAGDSMLVFDGPQLRVTVVSPSLVPVRAIPMERRELTAGIAEGLSCIGLTGAARRSFFEIHSDQTTRSFPQGVSS